MSNWKPDPLSKWAIAFMIIVVVVAVLYLAFSPGTPS